MRPKKGEDTRMTITVKVTACPDCYRPVYRVTTALGPMMRCERCAIDWFPDTTVEIPDDRLS